MHVSHYKQELLYSCLPACVRMVLAFYGNQRSESELRTLLKTRPGGASPAQVMLRLPDLGFEAYVMDGSQAILQNMLSMERPCIVHVLTTPLPHWDQEAIHALVVTEITQEHIWVHDPIIEQGPVAIDLGMFLNAWAATDRLMIVIVPIESTRSK